MMANQFCSTETSNGTFCKMSAVMWAASAFFTNLPFDIHNAIVTAVVPSRYRVVRANGASSSRAHVAVFIGVPVVINFSNTPLVVVVLLLLLWLTTGQLPILDDFRTPNHLEIFLFTGWYWDNHCCSWRWWEIFGGFDITIQFVRLTAGFFTLNIPFISVFSLVSPRRLRRTLIPFDSNISLNSLWGALPLFSNDSRLLESRPRGRPSISFINAHFLLYFITTRDPVLLNGRVTSRVTISGSLIPTTSD